MPTKRQNIKSKVSQGNICKSHQPPKNPIVNTVKPKIQSAASSGLSTPTAMLSKSTNNNSVCKTKTNPPPSEQGMVSRYTFVPPAPHMFSGYPSGCPGERMT